jgi:hypothetical protein
MAIHLLSTSRSGFVDAGLYVPKIPESTASTGRHLRAVKRSDRVVLFVDGQEVLTVPGSWPRSQVGLSAVDASARWNGITLFRLGSKYGVSEPEQVFGDDFDDNLLDLRWRRLTVHRRHLRLNESAARQQDTVPDIRFREANQQLQIQGAELGPWDISWSGSGLLYDAPISGAAKVSMEFDGFETRAPDSDMLGGGVGLRLWKADNNWIEIRRISDGAQQEIELSWLDYHTGRVLSASEPVAGRKGSFELAVDTDTGVVTASYNEQERWTRTMPDFTIGQYYAMVTAFTKSWDQDGPSEIVANVDNFIIQTQNSLNSGGGP